MSERCLSSKEVAALLGVSDQTVRKWRMSGSGPPYIKIGRTVRYRLDRVEEWLRDHVVDGPQA